jgi:hypothetical protein
LAASPLAEKQIQTSTNIVNTKVQKAVYHMSKETKSKFDHDSKPYKCAVFLNKQISLRLPDRPVTTEEKLQKWSDDINKVNSIDGYSWSLIDDVLEFSQHDDFWRDNLLSGEAFRKHFEKLYARFRKPQNKDDWYMDFK